MVRIKPKWLLGAMVALVALVALPAAALAEAPTGVNIVSPTNESKAAVAAGNNVDVTFDYTSVPMEANTTSVTIVVKQGATVVGSRTYAYPAIQDTGPDGAQFTGNVTIDSGAAEGKYDVVVTVTNHDGSASDTETEAVIVDNTPPGNVTGVTGTPPYTNDTTPSFTWTEPADGGSPASGIASYNVKINIHGGATVKSYTGVVDQSGDAGVQWSIPDGDPLPPGDYDILVWAVDKAANVSTAPGTAEFMIDTTAPVLDQQAPVGYVTTATPTLSVRFRDLGIAASGYQSPPIVFKVDSTDLVPPGSQPADGDLAGNITKTTGALSEGRHDAYIKVRDRAGNFAELTWQFFVDTIPPDDITGMAGDHSTTDPTPHFEWAPVVDGGDPATQSGLAGYVVEIRASDGVTVVRGPYLVTTDADPDTSWIDWSLPDADALTSEGEYQCWVRAQDNAGNFSSWIHLTTKYDVTAPVLDNESPANGSWTGTNPALSVRFTDSGAGATGYRDLGDPATFTLDGSSVTVTGQPGTGWLSGYITGSVPTPPLADGSHTVVVHARDLAGNVATKTWTFKVDAVKPSAPAGVILPDGIAALTPPPAYFTDTKTPKFSWDVAADTGGSGVASYNVEIWLGAVKEKGYTGVVDQDAGAPGVQWTIPDPLTEDELYEVHVYSVDDVGNVSESYASTTFVIDITTDALMLDRQSPVGYINTNTPTMSVRFRDLGDYPSGYGQTTNFKIDPTDPGEIDLLPPDSEPEAGQVEGLITTTVASALAEGPHDATITVEDFVGNSATLPAAQWQFFVDTQAPNTPGAVTVPAQTDDSTPSFSWVAATDPNQGTTGSGVASYNVEIWSGGAPVPGFRYTGVTDQSAGGDVDWALPDPLPLDGNYTIKVWAVDRAGNVSAASSDATFKFDTTDPVLDNPQPVNGSFINTATPTISVSFADPGAGASGYDDTNSPVEFKVDKGTLGVIDLAPSATDPGDGATSGTISATVPAPGLAEGAHTVDITVKDLVGKTASLHWTFTVDLTAPNRPTSVSAPAFTN
ncbi:MAG: hypothetical protein AB1563_06585, partial [Bacillota bacterium]